MCPSSHRYWQAPSCSLWNFDLRSVSEPSSKSSKEKVIKTLVSNKQRFTDYGTSIIIIIIIINFQTSKTFSQSLHRAFHVVFAGPDSTIHPLSPLLPLASLLHSTPSTTSAQGFPPAPPRPSLPHGWQIVGSHRRVHYLVRCRRRARRRRGWRHSRWVPRRWPRGFGSS